MVDYAVTLVQEFHHFSTEKWHHKSEKRGGKSNYQKIITQVRAIDSSLLRKWTKMKFKTCLNTTHEKQNTDITLNDCPYFYHDIYQLLKNFMSQVKPKKTSYTHKKVKMTPISGIEAHSLVGQTYSSSV